MNLEAAEIRRRLKALANPAVAKSVKSFLQSPWGFYGAPAIEMRRIAKQVARRHRRDRNLKALISVAERLWKGGIHEEMSVAVYMLYVLDRRLDNEHWPVFKGWMRRVKTWDHCDAVAGWLLGTLVTRDRTWVRVLRHWARSPNVWDRRAAVMGVLLRTRQMSDVEAAIFVCEPLMRDRDRRVQRAVGWILKEALVVNERDTREFLERWRGRARPLVLEKACEKDVK